MTSCANLNNDRVLIVCFVIQTEILKREASPAMRLLNDLLIMYDGHNEQEWLKNCKQRMVDTFPREDPFSILVPQGFDIDKVCWFYMLHVTDL